MHNVIGSIALVIMVAFGFAAVHDACGCTWVTRPASDPRRDDARPTGPCADPVLLAMEALAELESGSRYDAIGPPTKDGSRALGKYQVMDKYVDAWYREAFAKEISEAIAPPKLTQEQFLKSPPIQDAVVYGRIKKAWTEHGNIRDVASVWFTGQPYSLATAGKSDVNMSNAKYVSIVEQDFRRLQGQCSASGSDWACPADETFVLSDFGPRIVDGKPGIHDGIDIPGPVGNRNYAVTAGTVVEAGELGSNGKCGQGVEINHGNNLHTIHCHLSKVKVKTGDTVVRGQAIGLIGTSGHSAGPHTHFAVKVGGVAADPQRYLPARCVGGPKARTLIARN